MIHITLKPGTARLAIWALIALFGIGIVVIAVVYFATHGRVAVVAPAGTTVSSIVYCNGTCSTWTETKETSVTLPSDDYIIQANLSNNTSYVANTHVGGFLGTSTVTAKSKKFSPSTVLASSNAYVLPVTNGFLTYDPDSTAYTTASSVNIGVAKLSAAQYVDQQNLLMVEYKEAGQDIVIPQKVLTYNSTTNSLTELGTVSGLASSNISLGGGALYAVHTDNDGYTVITISANGIAQAKLPDTVAFATSEDVPIMSGSGTYLAFISGNDYVPNDSGEGAPLVVKEELLSIYDTSFKKIREIKLGMRNDISNVVFSPDSKTIAVVGKNSISTYNTESGSLVFETRASNLGIASVLWKDNSSFVYQLGTGGVYLADLQNKESYSIIDSSFLRITSLSAVRDNKVYVTAFPNKAGNYAHTSPDGYVIDLSHDSTSQADIDSASIVRELPYDGMTYSIGYHYDQNSKLILDVASESGARNSAVTKISELGFDPGDYTILFSGYTSPFGNPAGGTP